VKKPKKKIFGFVRQFVELGMPVLPLVANAKRPAVKNGLYDATTDRVVLKQYFSDHPDANFGVRTGGQSNIFVLDVDGPVGKRSLHKLIEKHGPLPKTVTVHTANGEHRYFKGRGQAVPNSAGKIGKGLDIRGDGGYVVGPGSVHPTGKRYRFKEGRALNETTIESA
jgi:putative DNA primase/helicase